MNASQSLTVKHCKAQICSWDCWNKPCYPNPHLWETQAITLCSLYKWFNCIQLSAEFSSLLWYKMNCHAVWDDTNQLFSISSISLWLKRHHLLLTLSVWTEDLCENFVALVAVALHWILIPPTKEQFSSVMTKSSQKYHLIKPVLEIDCSVGVLTKFFHY